MIMKDLSKLLISGARRLLQVDVLCHLLFWSWHLIYLGFLVFGLVPYVLWPVLEQVALGHMPWDMGLTAGALMLLPLASVGLGIWKLAGQPRKLFRLFYGVFAPAAVLLLARLFLVREMTPGVEHALWTLALGAGAYLAELLLDLDELPPGWEALRMVGHSLLLLSGLYLAALLAFFAVPVGAGILTEVIPDLLGGLWELAVWLVTFGWVDDLRALLKELSSLEWLLKLSFSMIWTVPAVFLGIALFFYSASLFVGLPVAMVGLYLASWRRALRHFGGRYGASAGAGLTALAAVASATIFVQVNQQPQQAAFAMLEDEELSDAQRLEAGEAIRQGLLNAYLSPWRYLGSSEANGAVRELWMDAAGLGREPAQAVQDAFDALAAPLVFDGGWLSEESDRAAAAYAAFFDRSIQEAERALVLHALSSTWNTDEVEAGLLNVGQRKVHLTRQEITVTERGDLAEVAIHEVYANQTLDQQEIFYLFNLPRSAAVTGLWLGDSDDRGRAFTHTVAPRGAAQEVYRAERDRRVDPALLEQLGPRQYRLRAFPIEPKQDRFQDAPELHLWMTYTVFAQGDAWPMPALAEARNVYWDDDTERTVNGQPVALEEGWLPAVVAAAGDTTRRVHRAVLSESLTLVAEPVTTEWGAALRGERYAVILDTSYSMGQRREELSEALGWLEAEIAPDNQLDLFLAASPHADAAPGWAPSGFDPMSHTFYGGHEVRGMLEQFAAQARDDYDMVLLLTDAGSPALVTDGPAPALDGELWMVHLGGLPPSYDDGTLAALQAGGGGMEERVQAVFQRRSLMKGQGEAVIDVVDGYRWSRSDRPALADDPALAPLAARQAALDLSRRVDLDSLWSLDEIHALAVERSVVTPYSSMIVLINDAQRERLKRASEAEDRFERESESGQEVLDKPSSMEVTGTPEPEEWLLILLACGLLAHGARRRGLATA